MNIQKFITANLSHNSTTRLIKALFDDVTNGGLDLRATSLVYTTLLSLAPLLAVSFSVLKAFGVHNQMQPLLLQLFEPLGEQGPEIVERIIQFVNNIEVGVLGFTGFALLFYTAVSLLQKIENSFNHIWRVQSSREIGRRFSEYLSVLLVGPVLIFSAIGLMASMTSHKIVQSLIALEPFGTLFVLLGKTLPTLFMIGAFTFLYAFIPNTKVNLRAAMIGGFVAGMSWRLAGLAFTKFVAGSAQYAAIYSSFAILIVFMIWLYVNWLILLMGVDICFYIQHPSYLNFMGKTLQPGLIFYRKFGLQLMYMIAERFMQGKEPWTRDELSNRLDLPVTVVESMLDKLARKGLVLKIDMKNDENDAFMPGKDLDAILVNDVIDAMSVGQEVFLAEGSCQNETIPVIDETMVKLKQAETGVLAELNIKNLINHKVDEIRSP